ncbi:MAG: hypothetical protein NVSMB56_02740 [Pyrinomonadaceae bacterium]
MSKLKHITRHILVCEHKTCLKQGGRETAKELKRALKDAGLSKEVLLTKVDCLDQCGRGPIVVVYPDGVWYEDIDERDARRIVEKHILSGQTLEDKILHGMSS